MENTTNSEMPQDNKKRPNKNTLIYGILIIALFATWAYIWWDKTRNNQKNNQLQAQVISIDSSKSAIKQQFQAALVKLDMLKSENDSLMSTKSKEVADLKARIQNILSKKNATEGDLAEARKLINQLQDNVSVYKSEIEKLKGEKIVLVAQRDSIKRNLDTASAQNKKLTQQVTIASILHAANFNITPIHIKNSGKEKVTDNAKRIDLMRISFELQKNLVADSGRKKLFVCINAPDGTPIAVQKLGSGKFMLVDGTEKLFTVQEIINYNTGEAQNVTINWKQKSEFKPGQYTVEVYEQGHLIGEDSFNLDDGGFIF